MKAYAKEVIRQQPDNIFEFSARYFAQLDQNEEGMDQGNFKKWVIVLLKGESALDRKFSGDETLVSQDALIGMVAEVVSNESLSHTHNF